MRMSSVQTDRKMTMMITKTINFFSSSRKMDRKEVTYNSSAAYN